MVIKVIPLKEMVIVQGSAVVLPKYLSQFRVTMRFLIQATIHTDMLNKMVQDSDKFLEKAENYISNLNPEATYFTEVNGKRTVILVIDIQTPEMIDKVVDTLALEFGAKVQIRPALILDDLKKSIQLRKDLKR